MDADRMPVLSANAPQDDRIQPSVLPTEKQDYDDVKEKSSDDGQGYQQTSLDVGPIMEESYIPGDPLFLDPNLPVEHAQFTVRAVLVGCAIGAVVQASNLYLGLKTGFTFGPQLLGGIGGFLVLKPLSRFMPSFLPSWVGYGYFGPKENVTVQSAATAAGGLGILFVSGFPAMYQIGLFSVRPADDIGVLIGFVMSTAFYGMTFAVPLRAFFILRQKLTFPTPSATAYAIRSLHASGSGAADAKVKGRWLLWSFVGAFLQKVVSTYAPGIVYDWHFFYWFARWGAPKAQLVENWGWYFEVTPAFFGAGILSGPNASFSFYAGSILAWGIIGPALVATGRATGRNVQEPGDPIPYRSYYSMAPRDPTSTNTSPRYNLLWIGVLVMLVSAFVELGVEWRTIASGFIPAITAVRNKIRARKGKELIVAKEVPILDPAPKKDQVPVWVYGPLTLVAIAITLVVQGVAFGINVGLTILALILAFIFSFIGVLSAGQTDINPVSTCAKASQLVMAGPTHGKYLDSVDPATGYNMHALRVNLLAGMLSAGAAAQASDLTGDLKTGHLLRAKPIAQYFAQLIGAFVSVFLSVAFFILFTSASPCILELDPESCPYSVPSAAAWWAVSVAVTGTSALPVPTTAGILAIVLSIIGAALIIFRAWYCPAKYKGYVPNPSSMGLAFVLPQTQYGAAMAAASVFALWWRKKYPRKYEQVAFSFAAGLITGEGLGGVMQAILQIAGAVPASAVSGIGCPGGAC